MNMSAVSCHYASILSASLRFVCRSLFVAMMAAHLSFPPDVATGGGRSFLFVAVGAVPSYSERMSPRVVETQYGKLRGVLVTVPSSSTSTGSAAGGGSGSSSGAGSQQQQQQQQPGLVEVFMGLQYATLLGSDLRFMPPTSTIEKWEGVRVAHKFKPVCPQPAIPDESELRRRRFPLGRIEHLKRLSRYLEDQDEECLNLNVYVPVRGEYWNSLYSAECRSGSHQCLRVRNIAYRAMADALACSEIAVDTSPSLGTQFDKYVCYSINHRILPLWNLNRHEYN
jgi:hypothetical protein